MASELNIYMFISKEPYKIMTISRKERPNVLILLPEDGTGGAERVFWDQVHSFSKFARITPCLYRETKQKYTNVKQLNPIILDREKTESISAFRRFFRRALALKRIVKEHNIDLVISHMDGTNWLNIVSLHRAKTILVVHGTVDHDQNISKHLQIIRRKFIFPILYNLANATVAVSEAIKSELQSYKVRNVIHIPNSFNIANIKALSNEILPWTLENFTRDHYLLVASGRLTAQKNFEALIDIFHKIEKLGVRIKLVLLGTGPLQETLEEKCDEFGIRHVSSDGSDPSPSAAILFAGYCDNPFPFVKRASLFLLPSKWEGYPLALCEAMICGTYPMSADCPTGPREIISPGSALGQYHISEPEHAAYGTLLPIPVTDLQKDIWAEQICNLLLDASRRETVGEFAQEHMSHLDQAYIIEKWRALIMHEISA